MIPRDVQAAWQPWLEGSKFQLVAGGLSNSRVWRVTTRLEQRYCLKAWPVASINELRMSEMHQFIFALGRQLSFVPQLVRPLAESTVFHLFFAEHFWELTTWLEGHPLSPADVQFEQGQSAIRALQQLHQASRNWKSTIGSSPAVASRMELLKLYSDRLPSLTKTLAGSSIQYYELSRQTLGYFERSAGKLIEQMGCLRKPVELCWVVRDLHCEHVLFQGSTVTGVIDFGAARIDEPLIDLVRLLGSLWPLNAVVRHQLVEYFEQLDNTRDLLPRYQLLDHVSTLLSAMQWLQWIIVEQRQFDVEPTQLLRRWQQLNERLECNQW